MNNLQSSLAFFTADELSVLQKIVKSDTNAKEAIIYKFERLLLSSIWGVFIKNDSYKDILEKIAKKNDIEFYKNKAEVASERDLYFKLFKREIDQMQPKELEAFYLNLEKQGLTRAQATSISGLVTIGAAQASGFGVYVLASSTVGAIASLVGVTLPFAFYTGLSTAISYAIGPLGLLVLGYSAYKNIKSFDDFVDIVANTVSGIKKAFVGDYERATLAFKFIASMRFLLEAKFEKEVEDTNSKLKEFDEISAKLNEQTATNTAELKGIYNQIYQLEEQLKALNSQKATVNFKNKELQIKLDDNNSKTVELKNVLYAQTKKTNDFKEILLK
ncbi:hypothetical protein [Flavobacterium sp. PL12]|uniref:hypothetical protein n=1 Tax=Flavobacterium sp. PL12 TaxID=3071718 RepID=UPI00319DEB91